MHNIISDIRKAQGITQEELAKSVGISRPYLSEIEKKKCIPGGKLMLKISKELKSKVEEIFFDDDVQHAEQSCNTKAS